MNSQNKVADTSVILLVAALAALAGGFWTLQIARETSRSIVNDPSIVALCVNGLAVVLLPLALWKLQKTRGLLGGLLTSVVWAGVASFLLNSSMEANAAESSRQWAAERAVNEVDQICRGGKGDARAKAFDPATTSRRGLVVVRTGLAAGRPHVSARQGLGIQDAELVACVQELEETVEKCTYDGYRTMSRVQVDAEIRFLSIKTGEEIYRTKLAGSPPRACDNQERFAGSSTSGTIRGNAPNPDFAYDEHFLAK